MSLNSIISGLDQESNIQGSSTQQYYNQEIQESISKENVEPHLILADQQAVDIFVSIQTNILQSTASNNKQAYEEKSEKFSENNTSANKVLSDLINKPITSHDSLGSSAKSQQTSSPSSQKLEVEGEDNKENESVNTSILSNIQNNLCAPISPCATNSPSRLLKLTINSRSSSSSKCNQKNDENEIQNSKSVSTKNSPQTLNNTNSLVLNNCTNLNKQSNQQLTQSSLQNVISSPFKERDQNKDNQHSVLPNTQNQSSNSRNSSSEKKQIDHQIQQANNTQIKQEIQNINQINEPLIVQKDQNCLFSDQEKSSEQFQDLNENQIESSNQQNKHTEDIEYEQFEDQYVKESENSLQENVEALEKIECYQIDDFQDDNQEYFNENIVNKNEKETTQIRDISNIESVYSSLKVDKPDQNQELISQEIQEEELLTNQISLKQEESNMSEFEQQQTDDVNKSDNKNNESEKENQFEQDLIVVDDEDRNIYQPMELIGAEEDEEQEEEDEEEQQPQKEEQKLDLLNYEEKDQNEKENYEEYTNKENIEQQYSNDGSQQEEEVQEKQEREGQQEQNNEDEHAEKSETIRHLENYQSIIRETDSYLDQLVMYILKEKATLTNIQKSIQVNHPKRDYSPSNAQKTIKQQNTQPKQDEVKQKKHQEEKDDYQYSSSQSQREEEKARKSYSYNSSSNQNNSSKQQQSYQQSQYPSKSYNQQTQYQPVASKNQQVYSHVNEILQLSIDSVKFGVVFPGNIFEEQVQIVNKTNETVFIKVVGLCLNPEFDSHGEYVYSIRKTINYDYNEKLMFSIPGYQSIKVHIALKVPNINEEKIIKGSFAVTVNGYDSYISIPITSTVEIPKIVCTRQLFHASRSSKVIKLAIRRGKKSDCKIPFKNTYSYTLQLEPFWLSDQTNQQHVTNLQDGSICPFQLNLSPQVITVQPKSLFMINLLLRPNQHFKDYNERRMMTGDKTPLHIKNVLIFRIVNSSLLFHYPVSLEVY
ncbi:hypothetical protein TTHERM_00046700 (macronuclear) [Tetrahymena thermophila SB210]|uniref:Uncharacterized protein n=1 Tax=Tetrahymena thermophila (strain SB210) TaxID=312017 RepID=Q23DM1_TETTS|nr:hypothetical protein TTHERM_00046700 [Tetrahymena thermophila SB210]EAR94666.1 hypothetical protein TTHERM_00046700 [Tetrahymena thermophila SB210]|eukprot:XP_001014665.1 hypothetical protein TTHERM_00046700 [Tetrahymena thermophila SB210]